MLLKEKAVYMLRHFIIFLAMICLVSCEEETPTSEFIPENYFRDTIDKLSAKVDGVNFFYDNPPVAVLANPVINGVTLVSLQIRITSADKGEIVITVSNFTAQNKTYTVRNDDPNNQFQGFYDDENGNKYEAVATSDEDSGVSGTLGLTVNVTGTERRVSGTFEFTSELDSATTGGFTKDIVRITEGSFENLTF